MPESDLKNTPNISKKLSGNHPKIDFSENILLYNKIPTESNINNDSQIISDAGIHAFRYKINNKSHRTNY